MSTLITLNHFNLGLIPLDLNIHFFTHLQRLRSSRVASFFLGKK